MARPEITKTPLGKRLRKVRRALGDPDRSIFSKSLGTNLTSLAQYERGDTLPNAETLANYRMELNIDLNWLLTGDGEMFDGVESTMDLIPGEKFMADKNGNDKSKLPQVDQEAYQTALHLANKFEKEHGKLMPNDKADMIFEFYKSIVEDQSS